jgi:GT2 family glycosyltransferase
MLYSMLSMKQRADVTIGIVAYHSEECLPILLASLVRDPFFLRTCIYIWDNSANNTTKKSIQNFLKKYPNIFYIKSKKNTGYGAGHNAIFKTYVQTPYYLILNPDTLISGSHFLSRMYRIAEQNPDCAFLGPCVSYPQATLQFTKAKYPYIYRIVAERIPFLKQYFGVVERSTRMYTKSHTVDWLHGCALLCRSADFRMLGGFDEDFYMYIEDLDLCYRASQLGKRVYYVSDARIIHEKEGESAARKKQKDVWIRQNYLLFFKKHKKYASYVLFKILMYLEKVVH